MGHLIVRHVYLFPGHRWHVVYFRKMTFLMQKGLVSHVQLKTFDISIVKHHRRYCYVLPAQRFPLAALRFNSGKSLRCYDKQQIL